MYVPPIAEKGITSKSCETYGLSVYRINCIKKGRRHISDETDMAGIVMGIFRNTGMDLDEYEQELFQKLMVHMLQRKR